MSMPCLLWSGTSRAPLRSLDKRPLVLVALTTSPQRPRVTLLAPALFWMRCLVLRADKFERDLARALSLQIQSHGMGPSRSLILARRTRHRPPPPLVVLFCARCRAKRSGALSRPPDAATTRWGPGAGPSDLVPTVSSVSAVAMTEVMFPLESGIEISPTPPAGMWAITRPSIPT